MPHRRPARPDARHRGPAATPPGRTGPGGVPVAYRVRTCFSPASTAKSSRLPGGGKGQMKWSAKAQGGR
nr:hypothetical protein KPHV_62990 [Kitasatospora purpeofusca]